MLRVQNLVLLKDASSPVPGCQEEARQFLEFITAAGVTVTTVDQALTS